MTRSSPPVAKVRMADVVVVVDAANCWANDLPSKRREEEETAVAATADMILRDKNDQIERISKILTV